MENTEQCTIFDTVQHSMIHMTSDFPLPQTARSPTDGGRRARKLHQTSADLLACAWQLFEDQGYEAVTMESIAQAADVARGTLYKHFSSKEAFIQHRFHHDLMVRRADMRAVMAAMPTVAERFLYMFQNEAAYAESMRPYAAPYLYHRLRGQKIQQHPIERDSFEGLIADLIRQGQQDGEIVTDTSAEQMAEYVVFLRLATLMRWIAMPDVPLAPLFAEMVQLFLNGAYRRVAPTQSSTSN
ncbi:TetR/AcrR family transcriptional regulator [Duganella sp. BJB488]|uniref:TetR/AcrR family transcriptional regulator n=1 Tax=unclassified Duganella TaxID=2636909 RepID=UPI000E344D7C|nr:MULTISPECIES: TetR/AcrR family transcriptional regulator [unclassified Duganella]RFP17513.1 TetR/AcrR family transcriptional regulator [Duganella sp. BJB489]RFP22022.1 TetR/AcrR family transcriptional regulator [Duganella sp. BJB488]RFP37357.1 TetR/AcrR family transcriptional regulator [Duganella sp. BJB480]